MHSESTLEISRDHPALPGHFPGAPIVPGVVLLDEVLHALERADGAGIAHCTLVWAKFRSAVGPGETLTLRLERRADGSILFEIRTGLRVVADGLVAFDAP